MSHAPGSTDTKPPRYTRRDFPPYRYLPFRGMPHPRNDPAGHSFHADEEYLPSFSPEDWTQCEPYLFGIDLFNHGYFWEAHETLEAVWLAAGGRETTCGLFIQGLIQLSAAQLKRECGSASGAESLTTAACQKLAMAEGLFLGVEVATLVAEARRCLHEDADVFPHIILHLQP